ncbi:hypothetical protein B7494_g8079 [Chlorociboria aeruginascens]|nr:hypothetical protein B7494_g8079 [Chlorociboria aeruginascens]
MEIPHRSSRAPLPSIFVNQENPSEQFRSSRSSSSNSISSPTTACGPMSIPNARDPIGVPPPLPPPRHMPDIALNNGPDIAWQWGNSIGAWGKSVQPGSSLYGSFTSRNNSMADPRPEYIHRESSSSTIKSSALDEGYASLSSLGSHKSKYQELPDARGRFQSAVHEQYRSNAQAYDKSLLQKLDARRGSDNITPPRGFAKSAFSTSANDTSPTSRRSREHRHPTQLQPLSLPIMPSKPGLAESPLARWAETPSSAISPGNPYPQFRHTPYEHRSPIDESDRSPLPFPTRSGSGSFMSVGDDISNDQGASPEHDVDFHMEETGLRRLQIDDFPRNELYSPASAAGQKRRASSPPREDRPALHTVGSASDLFRRRESAGSRSSPSPHFHSTSGSVSSTASGPRNNSYASTALSVAASSMTSMNSYGRLSPGGISPGATDCSDSPYVTSLSSDPSPRGSISRTNHQRTLSESRPLMTARKLSDTVSVKHHVPKMQGIYICECCPKKPKKFESQEDLTIHEQEKQYECAYCRNRFKNKNEAERHQNSLHLRRHSWSCAALSGYSAAFHASSNRPNEADTCGYCGEDFPRSGISSPSPNGPQIAIVTDRDWDIRIVHLQEMHKFGECNHAKKFFRADHFRQHLKHSHAGTSGKWTNMLENACMKDEPLPEPIRGPERVNPGAAGAVGVGAGVRVGRINEEEEVL